MQDMSVPKSAWHEALSQPSSHEHIVAALPERKLHMCAHVSQEAL